MLSVLRKYEAIARRHFAVLMAIPAEGWAVIGQWDREMEGS